MHTGMETKELEGTVPNKGTELWFHLLVLLSRGGSRLVECVRMLEG